MDKERLTLYFIELTYATHTDKMQWWVRNNDEFMKKISTFFYIPTPPKKINYTLAYAPVIV